MNTLVQDSSEILEREGSKDERNEYCSAISTISKINMLASLEAFCILDVTDVLMVIDLVSVS